MRQNYDYIRFYGDYAFNINMENKERVRQRDDAGNCQSFVGCGSLACVALIFLAVRSAVDKSMHALTACIVALVLLGVVFKLCHLIFAPLLAVGSISIVSGINKLFGALMDAAEGCLLAYILYRAFIYLGIYVL